MRLLAIVSVRPGNRSRPGFSVVVAAYSRNGCHTFESRDDVWCADVTGVNDVIDACERCDRLCSQQPMCVGDDADDRHARHIYMSAWSPASGMRTFALQMHIRWICRAPP